MRAADRLWQAFSCRHFHTESETEEGSGKRGRKPKGPNTRSRRAHRSLPHPPRLSAVSASSSGSSVPPNPPWGRYKPLATQEALGSSISCLLLPEAPPPSMSAMRSVWSPVAHRPSAVASRPAASRRIRRGYLRCISSYAIWLAAVITLANESHARVTRWKVEITMANFCFAGEWLCQCWNIGNNCLSCVTRCW